MKRAGWYVSVFLLLIMSGMPANALEVAPSSGTATKTAGPFLITGYSFSGHSLRYVQIYNASSNVASLDGWQITVEYNATQQIIINLNGLVEPGRYATAANKSVLPAATFPYADTTVLADPTISSITLVAPLSGLFLNESVSPSVGTTTPRVSGTPATFYFSRNVSTVTGNYLSTYAPFVPTASFVVMSDLLYAPLSAVNLKVVEIYPDAAACSPLESSVLCSDYVKLFNPSADTIDVSHVRLRTGSFGQASSTTNTSRLSGTVAGGHYITVPITLSASGNWVWLEDAYGLVAYDSTLTEYPSSSGHDGEAWSYNQQSAIWKWTKYPTPSDNPSNFEPVAAINTCDGLKISEITANVATEDQFVEIFNSTTESINVAGCVVQTNRSATSQYVLSGDIPAGGFQVIYIKDTDLTLTKTTTGTVYLLSSDISGETDQVSYENLRENTSWSLITNQWRQTYAITPGTMNAWLEYPPCESGSIRNVETGLCNKLQVSTLGTVECDAGKYRSVETNRCRAIETTGHPTACGTGEYRNPETNRCRSLLSTASVLTPCAANQERSPETNRCRSTTQTASGLTPCTSKQERNPETNRCRNKTSGTTTDFPVEAVAQASHGTLGWWAFGGVGTLAAGYAGWEWRREVLSWMRRLKPFGVHGT